MKQLCGARAFLAASLVALCAACLAPGAARVLAMPGAVTLPAEGETAFDAGAGFAVTVSAGGKPVAGNIKVDEADEMTVSLFGVPLKTVSLDFARDMQVVPCGVTVAVRFDTEGVMVLGTGSVVGEDGASYRPCDGVLKSGDVILEAGGKSIASKEELGGIVKTAKAGEKLSLKLKRDGAAKTVTVSPVVSRDEGVPQIGVWLRDSTQGIGTMTYYNPETKAFGALGHGILDVDTKRLLPVKSGTLSASNVVSVRRGKKGSPGELIGTQSGTAPVGEITLNTTFGLYGRVTNAAALPAAGLPVGLRSQVAVGPAQIRANVEGVEARAYDVYIESVNQYGGEDGKGMVVRITDPALIGKTGGIVQGMSGSPIIQGGRVVGAVTHVFVQNPLKGYGIFIENMLKQER